MLDGKIHSVLKKEFVIYWRSVLSFAVLILDGVGTVFVDAYPRRECGGRGRWEGSGVDNKTARTSRAVVERNTPPGRGRACAVASPEAFGREKFP